MDTIDTKLTTIENDLLASVKWGKKSKPVPYANGKVK